MPISDFSSALSDKQKLIKDKLNKRQDRMVTKKKQRRQTIKLT